MINWIVGLFTAYLIVGLIIYCVTNEENESWDWKKVLKFCLTWGVTYWNSYKENKDENNDKKEEEETK
jgi:hypothetical protein